MEEKINKLYSLIDQTIKYGLDSNYSNRKSISSLKKALVEILFFHLDNEFECDDINYPDINRSQYSYIKENLEMNFPDFGNFKNFKNISDLTNLEDVLIQNVILDLNDIIIDLIEVKYRLQNNGNFAGTDTFDFLFETGMKNKILNVINYLYNRD